MKEPASAAASSNATRAEPRFQSLNRAYNAVFRPGRLSLGLVVPVENHGHNPVPSMTRHVERVQLAEELGFTAVWIRDVPFHVPSFGDAGQIHDPFVYLGLLAATTDRIALGVASIILPLRHPAHIAKAAASADVLSGGRLLLGVASGDRPEEYPALAAPFADRGARFRDSFTYLRRVAEAKPEFTNTYGQVGGGIDLLPRPSAGKLPLLITGGSQQDAEWRARNGDGWMVYPRSPAAMAPVLAAWREHVRDAEEPNKPVMQPLYLDLAVDPSAAPQPIHLGLRLGARALVRFLQDVERIGVHHVALNLRFNQRDIEETLRELSTEVLPAFH